MTEAYIIDGTRTAIAAFLGKFSNTPAPKLASELIKELLKRHDLDNNCIDQVYLGHVITAGVGQAPARQAVIFSGLDASTPSTTINKVCGSGLEAIIQGFRNIQLDESELVMCGGMENMTMAPHLIPGSRLGIKFGDSKLVDSMQFDGLRDVYTNQAMGNCAEECARKYKIDRAMQDEFAISSYEKAQSAQQNNYFKNEITPVEVRNKKTIELFQEDDGPKMADFSKFKTLKPAFEENGSITAANASTLNDGAALVLLGNEKYKSKASFKIIAHAVHAAEPTWFTTAPIESMKKCLDKAKLKVSDIDLFEINEAFSLVTIAAMKEFKLNANQVNIWGGAVALGHPIGCSGARIVVTLMHAMKKLNKKRGLASICIGGGEALTLIIENLN